MNKLLKVFIGLVATVALIIVIMAVFKISPPPDAWPMPPWANDKNANVLPNQTTASEVDIYNKNIPQYTDEADKVMMPTVGGFAWNLDNNPDTIKYYHSLGVKMISEVSLWNHDSWKTVSQLSDNLKSAYVKDFDGNPVFIQEMVYMNLMDPAWREWLKDFVTSQLTQGADGIVIDETGGASQAVVMGAGMDSYSLSGFGEYLQTRYTAQELKAKGINDINTFNYKEYLINNNAKEKYQNNYREAPFGLDYYEYLYRESDTFISELIDLARSLKGNSIKVSANLAPLDRNSFTKFSNKIDYYTFENSYLALPWRNEKPYTLIPYGMPAEMSIKYAISQGKRAVVLPSIYDFGELTKLGEPAATSLVNHWFAETYANGGYFSWFDLNETFIGMKYSADHNRLRPYYAFVRKYPELLKDLTMNAKVIIVQPPVADMDDMGPVAAGIGLGMMLSESNIPYEMIDMDKFSEVTPDKIVLVNGYAWSDSELEGLLTYVKSGGTVIAFDSRFASMNEKFNQVKRPQLSTLKTNGTHELGEGRFIFFSDDIGWRYFAYQDVVSKERVISAIGKNSGGHQAPSGVRIQAYPDKEKLVVHLLNYDFHNGEFQMKKDFAVTITIPDEFKAEGKTLTMYSPDLSSEIPLIFNVGEGSITFTVPSLYIWDALILK